MQIVYKTENTIAYCCTESSEIHPVSHEIMARKAFKATIQPTMTALRTKGCSPFREHLITNRTYRIIVEYLVSIFTTYFMS